MNSDLRCHDEQVIDIFRSLIAYMEWALSRRDGINQLLTFLSSFDLPHTDIAVKVQSAFQTLNNNMISTSVIELKIGPFS